MDVLLARAIRTNLEKEASAAGAIGKSLGGGVGNFLMKHDHALDLAGLGLLAAPSAASLAGKARAKARGEAAGGGIGHDLAEIGGLGLIAAPVAAHMLKRAEYQEFLNKLAVAAFSNLRSMGVQALRGAAPITPMAQATTGVTLKGGTMAKGLMASKNPTLAAVDSSARHYNMLHPNMRKMIEGSQPVKEWNVHPHAAMNLAWMSRGAGESLTDSITRNVLHGGKLPVKAPIPNTDAMATAIAR